MVENPKRKMYFKCDINCIPIPFQSNSIVNYYY